VGHVSNSVGHMSTVAGTMTSHVMSIPSGMRRRGSINKDAGVASDVSRYGHFGAHDTQPIEHALTGTDLESADSSPLPPIDDSGEEQGCGITGEGERGTQVLATLPPQAESIDPSLVYPEQNIDIQGPNNGKKLTDDLAEIKDKMHELTWHLFDDHTYVIKDPNAVFFGDAKNLEKRRKKRDPAKQLNKYLHMAQYSHTNPFVSRVGLYVEPIIGSTYSLLCLFRAGFNVVTWRDPFLTFWLSLACGIIAIILFLFPWRIVLFVVGFVVVGPQNWAIRVMREQGHLPSARVYSSKASGDDGDNSIQFDTVPQDKPIFTKDSRRQGNDPGSLPDSPVDPREIHHVVVPYSPLVYQRCIDWPPEPEYAQVRRQITTVPSQIRRNVSPASEQTNDLHRFSKLRRRFRRNGNSPLGPGFPPRVSDRKRTSTEGA
jgi:hypothetical protein